MILAQHCMATMGVDQIFSGDRPGAPPGDSESAEELLFFNFQNPVAARTNGRQSAIDEVQRARLFNESHLSIPATSRLTQAPILFDDTKMIFFGHSQGGLNGPLFSAVDPAIARRRLLRLGRRDRHRACWRRRAPRRACRRCSARSCSASTGRRRRSSTSSTPSVSLVQSIIDVTDPLHYARLQATEPRAASRPRAST